MAADSSSEAACLHGVAMSADPRQFDTSAEVSFRDLEEQMLQRIRSVAAQHESVASQLRSREFELDERRKVVEASHSKLAELASQLAAERDQIEHRSQDIEKLRREALIRAETAESQLRSTASQRDSLQTKLEDALAESGTRLNALNIECERLRVERDQLAVRLDELIAEFTRGGAESAQHLRIIREQTDAEIARLRRGFEVTLCAAETRRIAAENRLASALAECESLKNRLISRAGQLPESIPAAVTTPAWLASRPGRLRNIKNALRRRAIELRALRDELSRREQALETRPAFVLHRSCECVEPITETKRGFAKVAGFAVLLTSLTGASWLLAGLLGSESFEAQITLGVQPKDRPLSSEELAHWNSVHRGLLSDPLFHEAAAARFRNIGELELGDAPRVGTFINTALTAESADSGQLTLRLRDSHPQSAERRLESLASALACYANGATDLRLESATTKVTASAAVHESPVASDRMSWVWRCFAALAAVVALPLAWFRRSPKHEKLQQNRVESRSNRRAA